MTVLVTGGTGFIGGRLVRALLADGEEVRALVRPASDARALEAAGATVVRGDVAEAGAMRAAAAGCEVVYSLAVPARAGRIDAMRSANVFGARNAALAARAAGARLVHASTTGVYGRLTTLPAGEDHPTRPERPYPRTKLEGERVVAEVMPDGPVVVARIASVYGPGDVRSAAIFRGGPPAPDPGGRRRGGPHRPGLRRRRRRGAARLRGPRSRPGRTTYNLAGGAPVPLREVLEAIAAAGGRTPAGAGAPAARPLRGARRSSTGASCCRAASTRASSTGSCDRRARRRTASTGPPRTSATVPPSASPTGSHARSPGTATPASSARP